MRDVGTNKRSFYSPDDSTLKLNKIYVLNTLESKTGNAAAMKNKLILFASVDVCWKKHLKKKSAP